MMLTDKFTWRRLILGMMMCQVILVFVHYYETCKPASQRTKCTCLYSDSKQQNDVTFPANTVSVYSDFKEKCFLTIEENHYKGGQMPNISKKIAIMNEKYRTKYHYQNISAKVWGAKTVDIENDYYPYVDFKFVTPEITPKVTLTARKYFMLVLVNSGAKGNVSRKHRKVIRQTWGNYTNCEQISKALGNQKLKVLKWLLVFVVGKAGLGTNDDELNMVEARKHNDMLIGNITDNYMNNIVKFYMGQLWASSLKANYILKTEDDVYIRIPRVLEYIAVDAKFPKPFYGGATYSSEKPVIREVGNKLAISWKYYAEYTYPPFNLGEFYILSMDLVKRLLDYAFSRRPFHIEDAFVGVAMRDLSIRATRLRTFQRLPHIISFTRDAGVCELLKRAAFGRKLDHRLILELHNRLQSYFCPRKNTVKC